MKTQHLAGIIGIRPFVPEDAAGLYEAARESMDQLRRWMVWCREDYSLSDSSLFAAEAARSLAAGERFSFAIFHRASGLFLGSIGLRDFDRVHGFATVGYWVRRSWVGRGIASSAGFLAAKFAFDELHLNRLEFIVPVGNIASERVALKIGAKREGRLRNRVVLRGEAHDALMMSLLPEDLGCSGNTMERQAEFAAVAR